MWTREDLRDPPDGGGFWTPPPTRNTKKRAHVAMPMSERKFKSSKAMQESFHKVPSGDSPYVRAKHAQLISKDPNRAISLFWAAINAGDRVDSALKDMAVVMKQLDRSDEGIEAIKSFRYLCPFESQDSIDNLLLELYKKSGRIQEIAELHEHKLKAFEEATAFGGRIAVTKRSRGKQINLTIEQEKARILGNLAWAHLQLHNYGIAEGYYRNALSLDTGDNNKRCNLAICLIRMDRISEAKSLLEEVGQSLGDQWHEEPCFNSFERAIGMLVEREGDIVSENPEGLVKSSSSDNFSTLSSLERLMRCIESDNNMNEKNSHVSAESVEQNSPPLFTQPRECEWGYEDVYERQRRVAIGAARRLKYRNSNGVETAYSTTNEKPIDGTKQDNDSVDGSHKCTTSKASKMCTDLVKEEQDAGKGDQRRVCVSDSSSAYARIMDSDGQRTV